MDPTELAQELESLDALEQANRWLARGDGIAVYENVDFGHREIGHRKYVSFGGPEAQLETDCATCGGTGQRATARSANGRELERHERSGTPCPDCEGKKLEPPQCLPDIGNQINFRYYLRGSYRGEPLAVKVTA